MMHMTFYWSKEVTILISSWSTDSWTSYAFTLLACFIASVFYQYMEDRRIRIKIIAAARKKSPPSAEAEVALIEQGNKAARSKKRTAMRFAGAAVFAVNSAIGYLLMLSVMSFNGGVFVSIVIGLATGYLLFRSGYDGDDDDSENVNVEVDNPCACS